MGSPGRKGFGWNLKEVGKKLGLKGLSLGPLKKEELGGTLKKGLRKGGPGLRLGNFLKRPTTGVPTISLGKES